jgi:hypothetical protein
MVQVMSEAKARPIITPFTTTSADMNIDHGDNSRGTAKVGFDGVFSTTAGAAAGTDGAAAAGAAGWAAAGGATGAAGCIAAGAWGDAGAAGRCWAHAGEASAMAAAAAKLRTVLNMPLSLQAPGTTLRR